jgi:hypothetical protein
MQEGIVTVKKIDLEILKDLDDILSLLNMKKWFLVCHLFVWLVGWMGVCMYGCITKHLSLDRVPWSILSL